MKIYYDYQICIGQKYGGISRYYYEIIHNMKEMQIADPDIECTWNINKYFESYFGKKVKTRAAGLKGLPFFFTAEAINILKAFFHMQKAYDIVHPTYYNPYMAHMPKKNAKLVITVYDMIHEKFPQDFSKIDYTSRQKKSLLLLADHIIAISESTKRDILELYPQISPNKISVIYIASSFSYKESLTVNKNFPEEYVLFVGRRSVYKNFKLFFEGVKPSLDQNPNLHLVCIGGGTFTPQEEQQIGKYKDRVVQMDASDDVLAYAYSHALCFVFPSQYEGFGIPTLEAFTCGCPVVLSNTSSMPEVGGDAVVYCDPYDAKDIGEKISKVLNNPDLRKKLQEKGYEQLKKFQWSDITKQIVECYEKVIKEK